MLHGGVCCNCGITTHSFSPSVIESPLLVKNSVSMLVEMSVSVTNVHASKQLKTCCTCVSTLNKALLQRDLALILVQTWIFTCPSLNLVIKPCAMLLLVLLLWTRSYLYLCEYTLCLNLKNRTANQCKSPFLSVHEALSLQNLKNYGFASPKYRVPNFTTTDSVWRP